MRLYNLLLIFALAVVCCFAMAPAADAHGFGFNRFGSVNVNVNAGVGHVGAFGFNRFGFASPFVTNVNVNRFGGVRVNSFASPFLFGGNTFINAGFGGFGFNRGVSVIQTGGVALPTFGGGFIFVP